MWGRPGAGGIGNGGGSITPNPCNLLFLDGNTAAFLNGMDWALLGCNGGATTFIFLDGNDWALLDGNTFEALG